MRPARTAATAAALTLVVALVAACDDDTGDPDDGWDPDAQFAPSLRPAFGVRVTDGDLRFWTGSPCARVTRVALAFEPGDAELVLTARSERGAAVEHLTLAGPPRGLEVAEPLPEGFDWREATSVRLSVHGSPSGWGSSADLAEVVDGSADHPVDTFWFQDVGWLDPAEVAERDGETFLATCTPDPAKE
ncbi:hypothetical protein MF406_18270 (plasmid) [Georgenia sp. TF02-10]|uniref:hypothetical protein n=1 Tax=Georgenia sp. TF02-10 TaxID=2917725 RepID=UPI001FA8160B|nr:hypothetical protein [Georgenia sp. TF02-10]UNX56592.1 hypothetical protein MF406_18270 [Georgenia sp. TF02-10]